MKATQKATKQVIIIARFQFKSDARKVTYKVRSSDGSKQYETCLFAGVPTSCTCDSRKPCKHMRFCEANEAQRTARKLFESALAMDTVDKSYAQAVVETLDTFYSERAEMVNAIRDGKLVEVRYDDLTANERRSAYNEMFA